MYCIRATYWGIYTPVSASERSSHEDPLALGAKGSMHDDLRITHLALTHFVLALADKVGMLEPQILFLKKVLKQVSKSRTLKSTYEFLE